MSVELSGSLHTGSLHVAWNTGWRSLLPASWPRSWVAMSGYLAAGALLGLLLIVGITLTRSHDPAPTNASLVTDNVVRLHAGDIADSCWADADADADEDRPARVTVSMEVGLDGKVRYAAATGESAAMRRCVESRVKSWEFLPQASAQAMVLPFEIDRR